MTLSKERLTSIAFAPSLEPCDYDGIFSPIDPGEIQAMASELLERRERDGQEPVAYMRVGKGISLMHAGNLDAAIKVKQGGWEPLYAALPAPQAPVVPECLANAFIAAIEKEQDRLHDEDYLMDSRDCIDVIREELQRLNDCRAAIYGITISNSADFAIDEASHVTAPIVPDANYQQLSELYHAQEKRLFKIAQRIKGPSFDKYAYSPSQAIDVLEVAIFGESNDDGSGAALNQTHGKQPASNGQSFGNSEQLEPVSQPYKLVGEVVAWDHPAKERSVDFRWLNYDVAPGTKLYAMGKE